ncbi:hypothetical protein Efla_002045 [Eimeria flavescens]
MRFFHVCFLRTRDSADEAGGGHPAAARGETGAAQEDKGEAATDEGTVPAFSVYICFFVVAVADSSNRLLEQMQRRARESQGEGEEGFDLREALEKQNELVFQSQILEQRLARQETQRLARPMKYRAMMRVDVKLPRRTYCMYTAHAKPLVPQFFPPLIPWFLLFLLSLWVWRCERQKALKTVCCPQEEAMNKDV